MALNQSTRQKMLTIAEKVDLLKVLKEGRSYTAVGRHYRINESSDHYIKDENNKGKMAAVSFNKTTKRVVTSRNMAIVRLESALVLGLQEEEYLNGH